MKKRGYIITSSATMTSILAFGSISLCNYCYDGHSCRGGGGIMDAMEESEDNVDGTIHDKHHGVPPFGKDDRDFLFCYG